MAKEQIASAGNDSKDADPSGDYDPEWYAQQALALGYISQDQAAVLVGHDADAAAEVMRTIWDFETDPAFAERRALDIQRRVISERLLSADQRRVLASGDVRAIRGVWREIYRHPDHEALGGSVQPNWGLDWPAGTPAEHVGPGRWRTRSVRMIDGRSRLVTT